MFFYVYVLRNLDSNYTYIGYTIDLQKRIKEHNNGLNFSTKPYIPLELIFYEAYKNSKDARRREKYLKSSQGGRLLKRMLKEYFYESKN